MDEFLEFVRMLEKETGVTMSIGEIQNLILDVEDLTEGEDDHVKVA